MKMTMSLMKMLTITIIKHELEHQLIDSTETTYEKFEETRLVKCDVFTVFRIIFSLVFARGRKNHISFSINIWSNKLKHEIHYTNARTRQNFKLQSSYTDWYPPEVASKTRDYCFDSEFGQDRDAAFQRGQQNRYVFNGNATRMESSRFKFACRHVVFECVTLLHGLAALIWQLRKILRSSWHTAKYVIIKVTVKFAWSSDSSSRIHAETIGPRLIKQINPKRKGPDITN